MIHRTAIFFEPWGRRIRGDWRTFPRAAGQTAEWKNLVAMCSVAKNRLSVIDIPISVKAGVLAGRRQTSCRSARVTATPR